MTAYYLDGEIDEDKARHAIESLHAIHEDDPSCDIEFIINSQGGCLPDGTAVYSVLHGLSNNGGGEHYVITKVRGMAGSIATLLVQAGDWRVQGPLDFQIWHEPMLNATDEFLTDLQGRINDMREYERRFVDIVMDRAKVDRLEIENLGINQDRFIMGDEALRLGLVDEVA